MVGKERGEELYGNCDLEIIRTVAYHREDFGLDVMSYDPSRHEKVRNSITQVFDRVHSSQTTTVATLRKLDVLPLEILQDIFDVLDIESLFRFRQLNLHARYLISTLGYYQTITTHALDAFCAILQTQVAPYHTLRDLYDVLCTEKCAECGSFGRFVFLLSFRRCCSLCLMNSTRFRVMELAQVINQFPSAIVPGSVLRLRVVPGIHPRTPYAPPRGTILIGVKQLVDTFDAPKCLCGNGNDHTCILSDQLRMVRLGAPSSFAAAIPLPYFDKRNGNVQHGLYCQACPDTLGHSRGLRMDGDREYSDAGFLEHFRQCTAAQSMLDAARRCIVF